MMKSFATILLLVIALGSGPRATAGSYEIGDLLEQIAQAAVGDGERERELKLAQSDGPTLSQAIEMVKRQCRCRILNAETKLRGKREVHHIKFLTEDGKVKTRKINGRTRKP